MASKVPPAKVARAVEALAETLRRNAEVSLSGWARWLGAPQHREHWSHFTDAIRTGRAVVPALRGGHGRLLAAILAATPHTRGILFDLPQVVTGAPVVLSEHRVQDRVQIAEGSFFDDVPRGGDAYVLKNVIHDWPDEEALQILGNVRTAAGDGKHVLLVELVMPGHNRDFMGNWLDLEMLLGASGRERTAGG